MINQLLYDYLVFEKEYVNPKIESFDKIGGDLYEVNFICEDEKRLRSEKILLFELLGFMYNHTQKIHFTKEQIASAKPSGKEIPDYDRYRKELAKDDWKKYSKNQKRSGLLDNPH